MLVREWRALEAAHVRGDRSACARWSPGCPLRVSLGGVGGNRWFVMIPEPIAWDLWSSVSENHRNAKRVNLAQVDKSKSQLESLSQRHKLPSAGGDMAACSSKSGAKRDLLPSWSPRTMRIAAGSNGDEYGQIL